MRGSRMYDQLEMDGMSQVDIEKWWVVVRGIAEKILWARILWIEEAAPIKKDTWISFVPSAQR